MDEVRQEWRQAMQQVKQPDKVHRAFRLAVAQLPVHPQYIDAGTLYNVELQEALNFRLFRLFSGMGRQVEAAAVEVNGVDEVLFVAESPRRVLHPLDLGVERLAGRVGDPMAQIGDDVLEAPPQHPCHGNHRF
jgi:hypothetical protein